MRRRRSLLIIAAGVLLAGAGVFTLDRTLEAVLRQEVNGYLSSRTLAIVRSTDFKALKIDLPVLSLSLARRRLVLRSVRVRFDRRDGPRYQHFEATAENAVLTGVDLSDLIWHRRFRLDGIAITAPRLLSLDEAPPDSLEHKAAADTLPVTVPAADSLLFALVADWLPDAVRQGRVELLRVNRAVLTSRMKRGDELTVDSSDGLSLEIRGLELDTTRRRVFERGKLSVASYLHATPGRGDSVFVRDASLDISPSDTNFVIGEMRTGPGPSGHALRLTGVKRDQILSIDSLTWAPLVPDSTYFRAAGPSNSRIHASLAGIRLLGFRNNNVRNRRLTASAIFIASANLDVLADYRRPGVPKIPVLWPRQFARLGWVVGVDSIVLDSGRIRYAEIRPGGATPATVTFDHVHARALNASNDSAATATGPVVLIAEAMLYGVGPLKTRITVPVREGALRVHVVGQVGEMPITAFNSFVQPASGIEILSGKLHEATFSFDVKGRLATGSFLGTWEEFNLRMVDKLTGEQNLGKKLKSLVARMMVKDDHMPDKKGRLEPSPIHYEVMPEDTFWGLIWRSLKSGMVKAIKG